MTAGAVSNSDGTASVNIVSKSAGSGSNYSFTTSASGSFSPPSFGISPSGQLSGGANAGTTGVAAYQAAIGYAPDGDVASVTDNVNGTWTYAYDDFNRLISSSCTANCPDGQSVLAFTYDYDLYGNRWHQNVAAGTGPQPQYSFGGANNRVDQYGYDADGDVTNGTSHSYVYDAENRLVSVDGGSTAQYVYDALGDRVEKTTSAGSVYYLYDLAGHVISELNSSGGWNRGEIYAGGKHVATYVNSTTYFDHTDWLGTERARTDVAGALYETCQSLPFGGDLNCTGSDVSPLHFTGKPRDTAPMPSRIRGGPHRQDRTESGLDYFGARYYGSSLGRFMTPDPGGTGADPNIPQTWNMYVYTADNPTSATDPSGLDCVFINSTGNGIGSINQALGSGMCSRVGGYYVSGTLTGFSIDKGGNYVFTSVTGPNASDLTQHTTTVAPVGQLDSSASALFTQLNNMPIEKFIGTVAGASVVVGVGGGAACYLICSSATATTLGITVGGSAGPAASDPELRRAIGTLFQTTDRLPGGTAGAVRYEIRTGNLLSRAGHSIKAQITINWLQNIVNSGRLSPTDTATAQELIRDLKSALATKPWW